MIGGGLGWDQNVASFGGSNFYERRSRTSALPEVAFRRHLGQAESLGRR
jgi:hypothetical protein